MLWRARLVYNEHNRKILANRFDLPETANWEDIFQIYQATRPLIRAKVYRPIARYSEIVVSARQKTPSRLDQHRIRKASEISDLPEPNTTTETRERIEQLHDAIVALQSLDDLDSPEVNEAVWQQMSGLQQRQDSLRENTC